MEKAFLRPWHTSLMSTSCSAEWLKNKKCSAVYVSGNGLPSVGAHFTFHYRLVQESNLWLLQYIKSGSLWQSKSYCSSRYVENISRLFKLKSSKELKWNTMLFLLYAGFLQKNSSTSRWIFRLFQLFGKLCSYCIYSAYTRWLFNQVQLYNLVQYNTFLS